MKTFLRLLGASLFLLLSLAPSARAQSPNGVEMFLKLDSVKGSSTNSSFKDQMVVLHFNYSITTSAASVNSSTKAVPGLLVITKTIDLSTPILAQAAAAGTPYQQAVLTILRAQQGELKPVYTITLSDVRVYGVSQSAATTGETAYPMTEQISLFYSKIEWAVGSTKAGYNFATNTKALITPTANSEGNQTAYSESDAKPASRASAFK